MHIRQVAEAVGQTTQASRFSENMSNHFMYGSNERLLRTSSLWGHAPECIPSLVVWWGA